MDNEMKVEFDAISTNEAFARVAVAAFMTPLNPTLEEIADVKTAVSEAVTNAIIHGYEQRKGKVSLHCWSEGQKLHIEVWDEGNGIADIPRAMKPLFTTKPEQERSGMGFSFMEAFMDELQVQSQVGRGTRITMEKKIAGQPYALCKE